MDEYFLKHRWAWCAHCEAEVVDCAKCGMNQCSGGSGTNPDGTRCEACESAYQLMMHGTPPEGLRP